MVYFVDTAAGGTTRVEFSANRIALESGCGRLHFSGDWGIGALGDARFFGSFTDAGSTAPVPASLAVQSLPAAAGAALEVTMRDTAGRIVLGPLKLQRSTETALPPGC